MRVRRRSKPKGVMQEIIISRAGVYRTAAVGALGTPKPSTVKVERGTYGIISGRAPGAPGYAMAMIEYGQGTIAIELAPADYEVC